MTTNKIVSHMAEKQIKAELRAIRKWRNNRRTQMKKQPGKIISKSKFYTMFKVPDTKRVVLVSAFGGKFLMKNNEEAKEMLRKDQREATMLRAVETTTFKKMSFDKPDE